MRPTMTDHTICDACERVAHCSKHGCIPLTAQPATQAGALQADDLEFACLLNREACRVYPDSRDDRINFGDGARWARSLAASQPNAAPAAEVVAQTISDLMRVIDAYAFDYKEQGKLGPTRREVARALDEALAAPAVEMVAVAPRGIYGPNDGQPGKPYGDADWIAQNHAAVIQFLERSVAAPAAAIDAREQPTDEQLNHVITDHGTGGWQTPNDMRKFARAVLALASHPEAPAARPNAAGQEQGWMPIATAPKDGVLSLFCDMGTSQLRHTFFVDWMVSGKFCGDHKHRLATHWMPLPATPPLEAVGSSGMTADKEGV